MICPECGCDYALARPVCPECGAPSAPSPVERATVPEPALATWQTSVGMSVLGVFGGGILLGLAADLVAAVPAAALMALRAAQGSFDNSALATGLLVWGMVAIVVQAVAIIVYAKVIYPSYFTDRPRLRSPKLISFLNCSFGSWVFGPLWNAGLTRGERGMSTTVCVVLQAAAIVLALILGTMFFSQLTTVQVGGSSGGSASGGAAALDPESTWRDGGSSSVSTDAGVFDSPFYGVSFAAPEGWSAAEAAGEDVIAAYSPDGHPDIGFECSVGDAWAHLDDSEREGLTRRDMDTDFFDPEMFASEDPFDDERVEKVRLGGVDYIKMSALYEETASGGMAPRYCDLVHVENGLMYFFLFWDDDEYANDCYAQFESAVASATYTWPESCENE